MYMYICNAKSPLSFASSLTGDNAMRSANDAYFQKMPAGLGFGSHSQEKSELGNLATRQAESGPTSNYMDGTVYFVSGIVPWAPRGQALWEGQERTGSQFRGLSNSFLEKIIKNHENHVKT